MTSSLLRLIETMAKEKVVEPQVIIAALEDATRTASRKADKSTEDCVAHEPGDGQIEISRSSTSSRRSRTCRPRTRC